MAASKPRPDHHAIAWEDGAEWALGLVLDGSRSRDEVADILRVTLANGRRLRAEAIKRNR
jgi:hypothetical protein